MVFHLFLENRKVKPVLQTEQTEVEIYRGAQYHCKLSKQAFRGACGITACSANIAGVHPSHCIYLFYEGKDEFDKLDIAYAAKLSEKKLKDAITRGRMSAHCAVLLYNILNRLRYNSKARHCNKCGIIRSSSGDCLNVVECTKRIEFGNKFIEESHLHIPQMHATLKDVFLLLYNKDKIITLIENMENQPIKPNLYQFFGLGDKSNLISEIDTRRTLV